MMLFLTRTLFIFTIVFYHASPGSSKLRSFSREWFLPTVEKSSTFFLRAPFDTTNSNFTFAICKDNMLKVNEGPFEEANNIEKNCNLFMIKPTYDELDSHITTCEFRAKTYLKKPINECDLMVSFAKDKVVLVSPDLPRNTSDPIKAMDLQLNTVDMNTCKVHNDKYAAQSHFVDIRVNIVLNNNTVDLVHENNDKCHYEDSCKQTYDLNGKEPARKFLDYPPKDKCKDRLPQGTGVSIAPNKGYFVSGIQQGFNASSVIAVLHVNSSGWQTELAKKELVDPEIASSDANGLYGFCLFSQRLENPIIHCRQFDADLNVKLNYSLKVPERVQWMAVHNLAERGLLLMTGNCLPNVSEYEDDNCQSFRIWRIYSTGRFVKVRDVKGKNMDADCSSAPNLDTRIVESDDGKEVHFEFQCLYKRNKPHNVYWFLKYLSLSLPKKEALQNL